MRQKLQRQWSSSSKETCKKGREQRLHYQGKVYLAESQLERFHSIREMKLQLKEVV